MKKLHSKKRNKIIVLILAVIMLCNFIMPQKVNAVTTGNGGSVLEPLAKLLCFIPDAVNNILQHTFVSPGDISNKDEYGNITDYSLLYSPGIIFSGTVPAFDINYVNRDTSLDLSETQTITEEKILNKLDWIKDHSIPCNMPEDGLPEQLINEGYIHFTHTSKIYSTEIFYDIYYKDSSLIVYIRTTITYMSGYAEQSWRNYSNNYVSTAEVLQSIVASWYKALRRIALVGLLSVLVYLGIRIVLSSTSAKDKAKYKKILKGWFEAVCLLFMLHYIMSLTISLVTQINAIIGTSAMASNGEDVLLSNLRNEIYNAGEWAEVISQIVIYATITVYTVIFTIQYLRRTIYMAFLTIIAPLITLTYPIDKVKDSKAQAFDMWLKDYIFFSLLQVLHLLIYYIFVSQAIDLSEVGTKWSFVYSIVAIGFLTQSEKIMKKMFGFQKSKSMGALAAGATGALVMNILNKASFGKFGKAPKGTTQSGGGNIRTSGGKNGTRTQTVNPLEGLQNIDLGQAVSPEETSEGDNNLPTFNMDGEQGVPSLNNRRSSSRGKTGSSLGLRGATIQNRNSASTQSGSSRSIFGVSGRTNRKTINKKDKIHYFKGIRSLAGKYTGPALSKLGGLALGGAGTLIGFSAGVAQGDIGKALTGAVAGGSAGYYGGQKLVNAGVNAVDRAGNIKDKWNNIEDTFNEGARGKEYVQNARFDRAFRESDDFKRLMKENPNIPDEHIQKMLDAGITEYKDMSKILKKNQEHPRKYSIDKAIGYNELAKQCPNSVLYTDKKFIKFCQDRDIEITPEEAKAVRKVIIEFK